MEKAVLNIDILNVTQGMNGSYSHKGDLAIDISRLSGLRAPFTGTIKRIYTNCNAVWLESNEKVKFADGTEDYMTIMTLHDNSVTSLYVGKTIKQGEIYYQQGTKGKVTGAHIHMAVGKGKFSGSGWYQNQYGNWPINNQYDITKALFVYKDVNQKNPMYDWKETNDFIYNEQPISVKYLNISPEADYRTVYKEKELKNKLAEIKPKKFNGLSYKILKEYDNQVVKIPTSQFGEGYISSKTKYYCSVDDKPKYKNGNY